MEERVAELERKVEIMVRAMKVLQTWMDNSQEIGDIDQTLFDSLNERVLHLEVHSSNRSVKE